MKLGFIKGRERRKDRSGLPVEALKKLFRNLAQQGGFKAVMMATGNGLISVNIDSGLEAEQLAEISRIVWQFNKSVAEMEPIRSLRRMILTEGTSGEALVCVSFRVKTRLISLIVMTGIEVPDPEFMEKAVQGIERILSE
ncbi:MAG: hypothetical protein JXR55_08650 [Candidatus Fermentibacteraceae bacterium]|nr:hypothetical protein [Candidatus Fermentibacteraceae bacterium]